MTAPSHPVGSLRSALEGAANYIDTLGGDSKKYRAALAAPVAPEPAKCLTCNGNGMIGGPSFYSPDEGGLPCPDCTPAPQPAERDREADRARFPDPDFNRWLDESIADGGCTVWHVIGDVNAAQSGWTNRPHYASQPAEAVSDEAVRAAFRAYDQPPYNPANGKTTWQIWRDASAWTALALAGTQAAAEPAMVPIPPDIAAVLTPENLWPIYSREAAAEPDTETMVAEVAAALEVVRARHIVEEVQSLDIGGKDADMPTQFQAGYQLACEEILTRIGGAHASDCALHNGPAYPPAPCDCIAPSEAAAVEPAAQFEDETLRMKRLAREAAEADAVPEKPRGSDQRFYENGYTAGMRAALAAQPPAPQAGWKLVPIEPTTEMMEADWNVTMSDAHTEGGVGRCAWAAMLAAAPTPEGAVEPARKVSRNDMMQFAEDAGFLPNTILHWEPALRRFTDKVCAALATPSTEGAK